MLDSAPDRRFRGSNAAVNFPVENGAAAATTATIRRYEQSMHVIIIKFQCIIRRLIRLQNVLTPLFDKASFLHERLSLEPPPHCMHRTPEVGGFHSRRASDVSDRGIGPADLKGKRHSYCGHGGSASTLASTAVITPVTPLIGKTDYLYRTL